MKKTIVLALMCAMLLSCVSCAAGGTAENVETFLFTDSAGRQVEVPTEIDSIAPSGYYAQIMLYTLCPEKLGGLSTPFTRIQKEYIPEEYWDMPILGQFYGGSGTVNYEEIMRSGVDIIIDIGEKKETISEDMTYVQEQTGIPVVFVEANLEDMAAAYDMLGELLGVEERASVLSAYTQDVIDLAAENRAKLTPEETLTAMYAQGEYGTEVMGCGSVHAQVLDVVGAKNIAQVENVASKGGNEVSMEQILVWDPDVVILSPDANYDEVWDDENWQEMTAVKTRRVYEAPRGPFNWIDSPPSVQRILGVLWLGNLLYPEVYDYDIVDKTIEFYSLFFHYDLSRQQAEELLQNAR